MHGVDLERGLEHLAGDDGEGLCPGGNLAEMRPSGVLRTAKPQAPGPRPLLLWAWIALSCCPHRTLALSSLAPSL